MNGFWPEGFVRGLSVTSFGWTCLIEFSKRTLSALFCITDSYKKREMVLLGQIVCVIKWNASSVSLLQLLYYYTRRTLLDYRLWLWPSSLLFTSMSCASRNPASTTWSQHSLTCYWSPFVSDFQRETASLKADTFLPFCIAVHQSFSEFQSCLFAVFQRHLANRLHKCWCSLCPRALPLLWGLHRKGCTVFHPGTQNGSWPR